ncbi:MAG: hypothetical protein HY580_08005 [Nitrospinae bacterium]|nr:hypothetical protein [Nitrospinota bacterium]
MAPLQNRKPSNRLLAVILLLGFGLLTGFSTVLHSHELDFGPYHKDCAPCHWSQSNTGAETHAADAPVSQVFQIFKISVSLIFPLRFFSDTLSRSPPFDS